MQNETQTTPISEAQTTPRKVTPKSPKQYSWLVIGLIVLVLLLLGTTSYFAYQNYQLKQQVTQKQPTPTPLPEATKQPETPSPTPSIDPTAGWETYTNNTYNYEFQYPNEFKITEESPDRVYISNNLPADPNCQTGGCFLGTVKLTIYFEHLDNPGEDEMNLDEYANARRLSLLLFNNEQGAVQKIQKFGLDVRYFEGITEGYNHNYLMKPNQNLSFYITAVFPSKEDVPKYQSIKEQILSTFKFIY